MGCARQASVGYYTDDKDSSGEERLGSFSAQQSQTCEFHSTTVNILV